MFKGFVLRYIRENSHAPGSHIYRWIKFVLAICVYGHLETIMAEII